MNGCACNVRSALHPTDQVVTRFLVRFKPDATLMAVRAKLLGEAPGSRVLERWGEKGVDWDSPSTQSFVWQSEENSMRMRSISALAAALAATVPIQALAQTSADRPAYWHDGWGWGWGHMMFGSVMMILFWGGLIFLIILAVRWLGRGASQGTAPGPPAKGAMDILEERYARARSMRTNSKSVNGYCWTDAQLCNADRIRELRVNS